MGPACVLGEKSTGAFREEIVGGEVLWGYGTHETEAGVVGLGEDGMLRLED